MLHILYSFLYMVYYPLLGVSLAETVVRYVKESVCKSSKESQEESNASITDTKITKGSEEKRKKELHATPRRDQMDPFLWAAFSETQQDNDSIDGTLECHHMDSVTRYCMHTSSHCH